MKFQSVHQALRTLENLAISAAQRDEAAQYLYNLDDAHDVDTLVEELDNPDFGMRWEAANVLAKKGKRAFGPLLLLLTDPQRVSNGRLREGAYHVLHYNADSFVRTLAQPLMMAIKGPAADIETMREANRLLIKINNLKQE